MNIASLFDTATSTGLASLIGMDGLTGGEKSAEKDAAPTTTSSGDTISISEEAKKLFAEKLHQYEADEAPTADAAEEAAEFADSAQTTEGQSAPAGGEVGSAGGASGSGTTESIQMQVGQLKTQLISLANQMSGGLPDAGVISKMSAVQGQIAALEAQLTGAGAA